MKHAAVLFQFIALVCISFPVQAQNWFSVIARKKAAGGSSPTWVLTETFETNPGYDNSWSTLRSPDPDYATSPAPLVGSYSLQLENSLEENISISFAASDIVSVYFQLNTQVHPGTEYMFNIRTGGTDRGYARYYVDGTIRMYSSDGGFSSQSVGAIATNTTTHCWIEYKASSGASDGYSRFAWSTDGTRPSSGNNYVNDDHNITTQADNFEIRMTGGGNFIIDNILIDDESIGDNPTP